MRDDEDLDKVIEKKIEDYIKRRENLIGSLMDSYSSRYHRRTAKHFGYKIPFFFGRREAIKNFYRELIDRISLGNFYYRGENPILNRINVEFRDYFDKFLIDLIEDDIEIKRFEEYIDKIRLISYLIKYSKFFDEYLDKAISELERKFSENYIALVSIEIDSYDERNKSISLEESEIESNEKKKIETDLRNLFERYRNIYKLILKKLEMANRNVCIRLMNDCTNLNNYI